jgi:flagellar motor switch protein FliM
MRIESIMAETELTAFEILNLKVDDVIVFNKNATSSSATIYINKKEKFSAISGISNNRKAIQIRANLDREKQETLDNLRIMREERETKSKEMSENIRKLLDQKG